MKNNIPLNYIKIDEQILTAIYKIPNDKKIIKNYNEIINKENKHNLSHKKYISNTSNNDNFKTRKNNYFPFKPFSSKEEGYKYYKQNLNTINPIESNSNNNIYLRKSKSPKYNLHICLQE